ncbi:MAG: glycine--tRNA ligase subunit beta [Rhodospirillales bacterium]|nr:glycine--tRNA ligase subunit beta [Rhodospirillales bacterium]
MPEFFLELFSEEIPARMQGRAADVLAELIGGELATLAPRDIRRFAGPRRIAVAAEIDAAVAARQSSERGPRLNAPEQALAGFLRKHGAERAQLREEGEFWVLDKVTPGVSAAAAIAQTLPKLLHSFPWPKSMRWGGSSAFTWVRPLRRIVCLLDGAVVPFDLRDGADDGHGLASSNLTEGHRFMAPGAFAVASCADWQAQLRARHVIVDAAERRDLIYRALNDMAAGNGLSVVEDYGLLDEVAGLVEWPVPLLGAIDAAYMDLPAEVMQVSMRVNQRYFALRTKDGAAAPRFAFVANIEANDGGAAIIAGNERVLRARFSDARHFWDLDRQSRLDSRLAALDGVTFHARLGSQGNRARRLELLAGLIAPPIGAETAQAQRAALLAKADLTCGMVGEFPELQGIMGGYYARHDGEDDAVADAIRDHYLPKGPADAVPAGRVAIAVALADKIDQLVSFFAIGEKPTGSGDPYALRRAALGVIRIVQENTLRIPLRQIVDNACIMVSNAATDANERAINRAGQVFNEMGAVPPVERQFLDSGLPPNNAIVDDILGFIADRLRVQLRAEGARHDILNAVLGAGIDDDITRLLARTDAVAVMLGTEDGANLLAAYRRAANILRIEEKKDGPHAGAVAAGLLVAPEEQALAAALDGVAPAVEAAIGGEDFAAAMAAMASLRVPLDAFFDKVTVNDPQPELRRNRLALLARVRAAMNLAADFSRIEG